MFEIASVTTVHGLSPSDEWMLVAGGFHQRGGQDKANAALARYLAGRGDRVTIVSHEIDSEFDGLPNVRCIRTPRVLNSSIASDLVLAPCALYHSLLGTGAGVRVVANGGNFATRDVNWVHFVHRVGQDNLITSPATSGLRQRAVLAISKYREGRAFRGARILIANSERTKRDILRHYPIDERRVHVVWLGTDPLLNPVSPAERSAARAKFGVVGETPVAAFVGALGKDDRKGFSTLFESWVRFAGRLDPSPVLLVAGRGNALNHWVDSVKSVGCASSIKVLGFRTDVVDILASADVLISPVRYEAYGLNVHEALARGIPAIVSRSAGVADRYPPAMDEMLLNDPTSSEELEDRLRLWVANKERWLLLASDFGARLREWAWDDMAERMVNLATRE